MGDEHLQQYSTQNICKTLLKSFSKKVQEYTIGGLDEFGRTVNMLKNRYFHIICRPVLKRCLLSGAEAVEVFVLFKESELFSSYV